MFRTKPNPWAREITEADVMIMKLRAEVEGWVEQSQATHAQIAELQNERDRLKGELAAVKAAGRECIDVLQHCETVPPANWDAWSFIRVAGIVTRCGAYFIEVDEE